KYQDGAAMRLAGKTDSLKRQRPALACSPLELAAVGFVQAENLLDRLVQQLVSQHLPDFLSQSRRQRHSQQPARGGVGKDYVLLGIEHHDALDHAAEDG